MSRIVSVKFNDIEEEQLLRALVAHGDDGVSTHIKRVYFDALRLNTDVLEGIRQHLEALDSNFGNNKMSETTQTDQTMMLSMLCGIYVMVRKSVSDSIRAQADAVLDIDSIDNYLKGAEWKQT